MIAIHENAQTKSPPLEEQIRQLELENHFFDILLEKHGSKFTSINSNTAIEALSIPHKIRIANALLSSLLQQKIKKESSNFIQNISAALRAKEMHMKDMENDACAFKEQCVMSNSTMSRGEKFKSYFDRKMKILESTIEKLKIDKCNERKKLQKIEKQIKQKTEDGNTINLIDFHQLQIENSKLVKDIAHKARKIDRTRISIEKIKKSLNEMNSTKKSQYDKRVELEKSKTLRHRIIERLDVDIVRARSEVDKHRETLAEGNNDDYPPIMDMVDQQARIYELRKNVKIWERKVEIAKVSKQKH